MTTPTAVSSGTQPSGSPTSTDRIERSVAIEAPRDRVWAALTTPSKFGAWFGCDLTATEFRPGARVRGPNRSHPDILFDVLVERMEPQHLFSWRWTPYPIPPSPDYAGEEPTLVEFTLQDAPGGGTLLRVVESGFDKVPPHRRQHAFRMHEQGWVAQLRNVAAHATAH